MSSEVRSVAVNYATSGKGTTLDLGGQTPFFPGTSVILDTIAVVPASTAFFIETCPTDSVTAGDWETLLTVAAAEGPLFNVSGVQQFIRINVTDTGVGTPNFAYTGTF